MLIIASALAFLYAAASVPCYSHRLIVSLLLLFVRVSVSPIAVAMLSWLGPCSAR
jgi:hypothetical protein